MLGEQPFSISEAGSHLHSGLNQTPYRRQGRPSQEEGLHEHRGVETRHRSNGSLIPKLDDCKGVFPKGLTSVPLGLLGPCQIWGGGNHREEVFTQNWHHEDQEAQLS